MLKIALSGNIASGKSQVEKFLNKNNIVTLDADKVVDKLYNNYEFISQLQQKFSDYDLITDTVADKNKISQIIFSDKEFKTNFENFVHPFVLDEIKIFFKQNANEKIVVVSVPLLFEVGWQKYFDKVVLIVADEKNRLDRLQKRNNISKQDAITRIKAQIPQEDKIKKSDYIINNNSSIKELEEVTQKVFKILNEQ